MEVPRWWKTQLESVLSSLCDRAEVKRVIFVSLAAGENEVVVHAEGVDKNSIRFVVK